MIAAINDSNSLDLWTSDWQAYLRLVNCTIHVMLFIKYFDERKMKRPALQFHGYFDHQQSHLYYFIVSNQCS